MKSFTGKVFQWGLLLAGLMILVGCKEETPRRDLKMVTEATFPPYEFRQGTKIVGIDPEILGEIARRNNYNLIIEDMNFNSVIAAVQTGKADVAASGITVTEERKQRVNFTVPYISANQAIVVPQNSVITGKDMLKDVRIGVQHGTTGDQYVTKNVKEPERYENAALTIAAVLSGKLDAVVLDDAPAREFVKKHPKLKLLDEPLTSEYYAFAINKEAVELLEVFNKTLNEMKRDGTLQAILDKYLKKDHNATDAQAAAVPVSFWGKFKKELQINFVDSDRYMYLVKGFGITLWIALCSVLVGFLIGLVVAIIRSTADNTGKLKILNFICKVYLTVIRGTPVVVQLLIIYFVIFGSMDISKVLVAIAAFGLNSGAYVAEIIRSGINSIDRGQLEAGRSLGLSYRETMTMVIMPQALKNVLPALGNEFIVLLKETSVSGYIALQDLTKAGDIIRSQTYNAFLPLLAVAAIYLAVVMLFSKLLSMLEKRLKRNE